MEQLENELRQQAQILGDLNLELNKYVEENQKISEQIINLEQRIAKKVLEQPIQKKMVDQQSKDKNIIHQKLVQAQRKKQAIQVEVKHLGKQMGSMEPHPEEMMKKQPQEEEEEIKRPESLSKPPKKEQKPPAPKKQQSSEKYQNADKGDYEPPNLFGDGNKSESQQSSEEANGEELLSSIQQRLSTLKVEGDEDNQQDEPDS